MDADLAQNLQQEEKKKEEASAERWMSQEEDEYDQEPQLIYLGDERRNIKQLLPSCLLRTVLPPQMETRFKLVRRD